MLKFFKEIDLDRKLFVLPLNWAGILAFVAFWTYGFFGVLSAGSAAFKALIFLVLLVIFLTFIFFSQKRKDFFGDEIIFRGKDLLVLAVLFLILFSLSFSNLTASITNDGLAHAQQAELHGSSLVYLLSGKLGFLNNLIFTDVLWTINFAILVFAAILYLFLRKRSFWLKATVFSVIFILSRVLVLRFGGSGGVHPPFRLFPLWLSGTVFYPSDFAFRFAQFFGLILFGWLVWRLTEKRLGSIQAGLAALSVITIPVLWHVGILVEQSVWAAIAWGAVLLYMYFRPELKAKDYLRLIAGISITTLMRQTAFVVFLPVLMSLAYDFWKKKINFKELLLVFSPALVMAPFLLKSLVFGTSASYVPGADLYVPAGLSGLGRVWFAVKSGMVWTAATNSVDSIWIFFGLLAFIFSAKNLRKFLGVLALLSGGIFIFYLISPGLWGIGRYQAEYVVPFAVLGFAAAAVFVKEKFSYLKYALPAGLLILTVYNIYIFKNISRENLPTDILVSDFSDVIKKEGEYTIITEFPYDYHSALAAAKAGGYADSLYVVGATYGVLPEILNGFTVGEVLADKKLAGAEGLRSDALNLSPEDINLNKGIKLVLISDMANASGFSEKLKSLGWIRWEDFKNETYGATIFGLIRKQ